MRFVQELYEAKGICMSGKYVDIDAIHDILAGKFCACSDETEDCINDIWREIKQLQTADVAPRKTGVWIHRVIDDFDCDPYGFFRDKYFCSVCGEYNTYGMPDYCPCCGSKMTKPDGWKPWGER